MEKNTFLNYAEKMHLNLADTHISELSQNDLDFIDKAYQFADMAHKNSTRKGTDIPYITHPVEAACIALEMTANPVVIAAALLHDVVEDTDYDIEAIKTGFGDAVATLVAAETEDKRPDMPKEQSWKIRKQEFLDHLATISRDAMIVALADKLSNMRAMQRDYAAIGDAFWQRFNQKDPNEHAWYHKEIVELTRPLSDTKSWQEYDAICRQMFPQ